MSPASLALVGFANPFDTLPGFLLPIFATTANSNALYLQAIGPDGRISAFEAAEVSEKIFPSNGLDGRTVGEDALYAFGTAANVEPLVGSRSQLVPLLVDIMNGFRHLPALYFNLAEFCATADLRDARRRAYSQIQKSAGMTAARSWRDSQVLLPIIRSALVEAGAGAPYVAQKPGRISIYSTSAKEVRVRADGYIPETVARALRGRVIRNAFEQTGIADNVTVTLIDPKPPQAPNSRPKPRPTPAPPPLPEPDHRHAKLWHSLEIAFEELRKQPMSQELRSWLNRIIREDLKSGANAYSNFVFEWSERETPRKGAPVLSQLLSLEFIPDRVFDSVTHWLDIHVKHDAAGQVFAAAIRARHAQLYSRNFLSRHFENPERFLQKRKIMAGTAIAKFQTLSLPYEAVRWVEAHGRSFWSPAVLVALLKVPGRLPELENVVRDWLKHSIGYSGKKYGLLDRSSAHFSERKKNYDGHGHGQEPPCNAGNVLLLLLQDNAFYRVDNLEERTLDWIAEHPHESQTVSLWSCLLSQSQLVDGKRFIDPAKRWIIRRRFSSHHLPVLLALLKLIPEDKGLRKLAVYWIEEVRDLRDAVKLLTGVLTPETMDAELRRKAENWLDEHGSEPEALPVLRAYFRARPRIVKLYPQRVALDLAARYPKRAGVGALYAVLIERFGNDERTIGQGLAWLKGEPSRARGRPLIRALLTRRAPEFHADIAAAVRHWLHRFPDDRTTLAAYEEFRASRRSLKGGK